MKKLGIVVLIILFLGTVGLGIAGITGFRDANNAPAELTGWQKVRVADEALYPENFEYVDYATEVRRSPRQGGAS